MRQEILKCVKDSKYYSIIADATTDITHKEQMVIVLRYLFLNENSRMFEIKESFVEFVNVCSG